MSDVGRQEKKFKEDDEQQDEAASSSEEAVVKVVRTASLRSQLVVQYGLRSSCVSAASVFFSLIDFRLFLQGHALKPETQTETMVADGRVAGITCFHLGASDEVEVLAGSRDSGQLHNEGVEVKIQAVRTSGISCCHFKESSFTVVYRASLFFMALRGVDGLAMRVSDADEALHASFVGMLALQYESCTPFYSFGSLLCFSY